MAAQLWLLGLLMIPIVASQLCTTQFRAAWSVVADFEVPLSSLTFDDPELKFYRETLHFTAQETQQQMENAIQHFRTQFGLDFSSVEPNSENKRFLGNARFEPLASPLNLTIVSNRWINSGNRRSACYPMGSGTFSVNFNGTTTLYGEYGGEAGRQVNEGDALNYGHFIIFGACAQQPIVIQLQNNIPAHTVPSEGWIVDYLQLYHRQLGTGRAQIVFKSRPSATDPSMLVIENMQLFSFP